MIGGVGGGGGGAYLCLLPQTWNLSWITWIWGVKITPPPPPQLAKYNIGGSQGTRGTRPHSVQFLKLFMQFSGKFAQTRMHSSGLRTACLLTVPQHALGGGRGCLPEWVYLPLVLGVEGAADTSPSRGQTDTCENITFANLVCGR